MSCQLGFKVIQKKTQRGGRGWTPPPNRDGVKLKNTVYKYTIISICVYIKSNDLYLSVITQIPLTDLPQLLIGELGRPTGISHFGVKSKNSNLNRFNFKEKTLDKVGFRRQ